jgi:hypothetical protein
VKLWPFHAIFLTLGAGGMILGTIALYRRKWKLFLKFHMWIMAASVGSALIGIIIGIIMVENSTGVHLRVPHSYFGPLTFLVSLFALGIGFYFKYTKNMKHKRPTRTIHLYAGWAGAGLFIMTTISGFIQALVTAGEDPPIWFLVVIGLIIAMLIGVGIYVIMMGRKKPPVKKSEETPPPPVEETQETEPEEPSEEQEEEEIPEDTEPEIEAPEGGTDVPEEDGAPVPEEPVPEEQPPGMEAPSLEEGPEIPEEPKVEDEEVPEE